MEQEGHVQRLEAERLRRVPEVCRDRRMRDLADLDEIIHLLAAMMLPGWRRGDPA